MEHDSTGCTLCGLPVTADSISNDNGERFCCPGCRDVHSTLDDVPTVSPADFQGDSPDRESQRDDTSPPTGQERTFLQVNGMHCTTCETFLETLASRQSGVSQAVASYVTETVRIDHDPDEVSVDDLRSTLSTGGYTARLRQDTIGARTAEDDLLWRVAAGVMLSMMVMLPYLIYIYPVHFSLYPPWMLELVRQQLANGSYFFYLLFLFTTLILLYTGGPLLRGAIVSVRARQPNMDLLVALAALSAYTYSTLAVALGRIDVYYDVTVAIVVVVTAGNYYESAIKRRATDLLSELGTARVDEAHLLRKAQTAGGPTTDVSADDPTADDSTANDPTAAGSTTTVSVDDLNPGDWLLVREGERIPVDGVVREGACTVNEAVVTGESLPAEKRSDDAVVGGSILATDAAVVEVGEEATSSLDRLTQLVWNLQSTDRGVQKLANRLAVVFVPVVLALAFAAAAVYLVAGAGVTEAVLVGLTVLIVSCPCALGLATPLAVASSIREAIERGIVVFDDTIFERLRSVDTVVFDKTGTLTTGELGVREVHAPRDLLEAAAVVERRSAHPVAEAVVAAVDESTSDAQFEGRSGVTEADGGVVEEQSTAETTSRNATNSQDATDSHDTRGGPDRLTEFRSHARGVEGVVDGRDVLVGHPGFFTDHGWEVPDAIEDKVSAARAHGALPVVLGRDGRAGGVLALEDEPRSGWAETVTALGDRGIDVVLLTGDDEAATDHFHDHPAIDQVFAGVPPEAKVETIRRLGVNRQVAMVGDGTNDGPALACADLGIALGSGTALAVDAADIAIVDDDLASIGTVFDLSVAAGKRIKQNIGWAFLYNAVAIPLAVLGFLNPLFAAVAMASSSLLVVSNSSRELLDE